MASSLMLHRNEEKNCILRNRVKALIEASCGLKPLKVKNSLKSRCLLFIVVLTAPGEMNTVIR